MWSKRGSHTDIANTKKKKWPVNGSHMAQKRVQPPEITAGDQESH